MLTGGKIREMTARNPNEKQMSAAKHLICTSIARLLNKWQKDGFSSHVLARSSV